MIIIDLGADGWFVRFCMPTTIRSKLITVRGTLDELGARLTAYVRASAERQSMDSSFVGANRMADGQQRLRHVRFISGIMQQSHTAQPRSGTSRQRLRQRLPWHRGDSSVCRFAAGMRGVEQLNIGTPLSNCLMALSRCYRPNIRHQ